MNSWYTDCTLGLTAYKVPKLSTKPGAACVMMVLPTREKCVCEATAAVHVSPTHPLE